MKVCSIDDCRKPVEARGWCAMHYSRWRRHGDISDDHGLIQDGSGVCECPISYPGPKCCTVCGFPSVYRMAPHIRDRALTRMPTLRNQQTAQEVAA